MYHVDGRLIDSAGGSSLLEFVFVEGGAGFLVGDVQTIRSDQSSRGAWRFEFRSSISE
jgi:hypothetical protein